MGTPPQHGERGLVTECMLQRAKEHCTAAAKVICDSVLGRPAEGSGELSLMALWSVGWFFTQASVRCLDDSHLLAVHSAHFESLDLLQVCVA